MRLILEVLRCLSFRGGITHPFTPFRYFSRYSDAVSSNNQNMGYLLDIKFIFGRCNRGYAERSWTGLTGIVHSEDIANWKLAANGAVTSSPNPSGVEGEREIVLLYLYTSSARVATYKLGYLNTRVILKHHLTPSTTLVIAIYTDALLPPVFGILTG